MFKSLTEKARLTIVFSVSEGRQSGSSEVSTEHILLALLKDASLTDRLLEGLSVKDIREEILARRPRPGKPIAYGDLPLSKESREALDFAREEADSLGKQHVGNGGILLGLLRLEDCLAAKVLREKGLSVDKVRSRITARDGPK